MTEEEWLASTYPTSMLAFLNSTGRAGDRKFRLFACASCRRIWHFLPDERSRSAVHVAERFADGLATPGELRASHLTARAVSSEQRQRDNDDQRQFVSLAASDTAYPSGYSAATSATFDAAWNPIREASRAYTNNEEAFQAEIVRDIFGNPFRPATIDPAWRTSTVVAMAEDIYDERAFDRMPILADALQDAGCDNDGILNHCRSDGPHVRGCWVIDLLTSRE